MSGLTNYSHDRPLILLTDYSPRFGGGGAINLRSVMDPETRSRIVWVTLTPDGEVSPPAGENERVVVLKGGMGATVPRVSRSLFQDTAFKSAQLAQEVLSIARSCSARGIWVVMHGAAVPIAAHLVKQGEFPVVASVHDDPAFGVALRSRRYLALVPLIERAFARTLKRAAGVEVVSQGMMDRYRRRYGVEGVFGNRAVAPFVAEPAPFSKEEKVLRIGVLGNTYSYSPLPILGKAVGKAASDLGIRGELVFVGQGQADRLRADLGGLVDVVGVGQVAEDRGVEVLRGSFLQYLNYPFGWRDKVLRQTSFPIKLGTYIAAGRPLLLHTPSDSSTADLAQIPGLGYHWGDLSSDNGAEVLKRAWADPQTSEGANLALEAVRRKYFDLEMIKSNVMGLLNRMVGPLPDASPSASSSNE